MQLKRAKSLLKTFFRTYHAIWRWKPSNFEINCVFYTQNLHFCPDILFLWANLIKKSVCKMTAAYEVRKKFFQFSAFCNLLITIEKKRTVARSLCLCLSLLTSTFPLLVFSSLWEAFFTKLQDQTEKKCPKDIISSGVHHIIMSLSSSKKKLK